MKISFNTTNKSLVPNNSKIRCVSAYESADYHIKCREIENHYLMCKYIFRIR